MLIFSCFNTFRNLLNCLLVFLSEIFKGMVDCCVVVVCTDYFFFVMLWPIAISTTTSFSIIASSLFSADVVA